MRAADKVKASLIVVYTHTGRTAQLVAKYRPPMPILTLVVPRLVSDALRWRLEGRHNARQCLLTRGLLPMLATPQPHGDAVLEEAITVAARCGSALAFLLYVFVLFVCWLFSAVFCCFAARFLRERTTRLADNCRRQFYQQTTTHHHSQHHLTPSS